MPKKPAPVKIPPICKKTGGKVDDVVLKLLGCGNDEDGGVKEQVFESLTILGSDQSLFVITQSIDFINKTNPGQQHRHRILELCASIIDDKGKDEMAAEKLIPEDIITHTIRFCTNELHNKYPEVQTSAVKMLVGLSFQYCSQVTDAILSYFQTGKLPTFYILKALADIAAFNPIQFVDKLGDVFSKITPVLGLVQKPAHMKIFTLALGRFAEAILKYQGEMDEDANDSSTNKNNSTENEEESNNNSDDSKDDSKQSESKKPKKKAKMEDSVRAFTAFETNCASAFDVVFTNWKKTKDVGIRTAVSEALGLLAEVMSPKRFAQRFVEVIHYFVTGIKQANASTYPPLVRGLCSCLKVMYRDELCDKIDDIEKYMTMSMDVVHPLAGNEPNYEDPKAVKSYSYTLQCFEYLARSRLTQTLTYLLGKFQSKGPSPKLASLCILKHIVGHMDEDLDGSKSLILSSCQTLMAENDLRTRKAFIHLIMGMAGQDYLTLEGGQNMILFLVKQSAVNIAGAGGGAVANAPSKSKSKSPGKAKAKASSKVSAITIRNGAAHILHVIANQVVSTHDVLWPYLFELLAPSAYTLAVGDICRVLSHLARTKRSNDDPSLNVQWASDVNLPHPGTIIVRLFVLLNRPFLCDRYGEYICSCMHSVGGIIHENLQELWFDGFKILGQFLQKESKVNVSEKFPGMLLKLYRETCTKLETDDAFITEMGNALVKQWGSYRDKLLQKVVLTYLGQTLAFSRHKQWLNKNLEKMLDLANDRDPIHIEGVALGFGLCGAKHLDIVLVRTTQLQAMAHKKTKSKFFGMGGGKSVEGAVEKKIVCVRSWAWISKKTPSKLITSRMDAHIFTHLIKIMQEAKKESLKLAVVETLELISEAMSDAYEATEFLVKKRDTLILGMLDYIKTSSKPLQRKAMTTIASLLYLEPAVEIGSPLRQKIIDSSLSHLNSMSDADAGKLPVSAAAAAEEKKESGDTATPTKKKKAAVMSTSILQSLQSVLVALLETQPTVESICQLIFKIEYWVVAKRVNERVYALQTYKLLIKRFIKLLRKGAKQTDVHLKNLGHYLATIIPRVTDTQNNIRELAIETIQMLLFIDQLLRNPGQEKPSEQLRSLNSLKKELIHEKVPETRLTKMYHLAEILCALTSAPEMQTLLPNLIRGVNDDDRQAALGTCKALQGILRERALETKDYVEKLLEINLSELKKQSKENAAVTKQQLMSICILTREHFELVMEFLHKQGLPLDRATTLVFKALAADKKLQTRAIDYELGIINNSPITTGTVAKTVCIATKALGTFFTLDETKVVIEEYYFRFFTTLITRLGTASCKKKMVKNDGKKKAPEPKKKAKKKSKKSKQTEVDEKAPEMPITSVGGGYPVTDTINAIRAFLILAEERLLLTNMKEDGTWNKLSKIRNYELGVADLVGKWATIHRKQCRALFEAIFPFFKKHYLGHRNSAAVVVAELIRHCGKNKSLLDQLVQDLLPRVADNEARVRRQALIGLGNLSEVWNQELVSIAPSVLASLASAIEDREEIVRISAIHALTAILVVMEEETVSPSLITICFRTRPFLDDPNEDVRGASFALFGKLCRFGYGRNQQNFLDQVHINMCTFIMHCNDVNDTVSAECFAAFKTVAEYLEDESLQVCLNESGVGKGGYLPMLARLCPILVGGFEERLPGYLQNSNKYTQSRWGELRGNASLFSAKIIECCPEEYKSTLDIPLVVDAIMKLMASKSARVRQRVAKSLSYLSQA